MKKLLKSLTPSWIKTKLSQAVVSQLKESNTAESNAIPKHQLKPNQIANTTLLVDRQALLNNLPKNAIVAELGVDKGEFSERILATCQPEKLHLIDFWGSERYNQDKRQLVEQKFEGQIAANKLEINLGLSTDVGAKFNDNYFDWIYIDTDHTYQTTIKELEVWRTKMKPNGIIAGHDYIVGNWDGMVRYGVVEAVYEFCAKYNWEIIYITMEIDMHPSFAIQKM